MMSRLSPIAALAAPALALAAGLPAAAAPAGAAATTYTITDLGSLGGGASSATGINATGEVTGGSSLSTTIQTACLPYQKPPCYTHPSNAFLWDGKKMTGLGTLGGNDSAGDAINLSGQVAGASNTSTGGTDAVLWTGKTITDLGALAPLAGSYSTATGINDSGQVVGSWGNNPSHTWLYANGTITDLPEPSFATATGATGCTAAAINNSNPPQIVGSCTDANHDSHAMLWQNGTVTALGVFGGPQATAAAVNNLGQVVGWGQTSTTTDGFLYSNGKITNLGTFFPAAINDNGAMVGGDQVGTSHTVQNLNNLIPAGTPYQIRDATAINNNGQIVADAFDNATGQDHALLLSPH